MKRTAKKLLMFLALTLIFVISAVSFVACGASKEIVNVYSYQTHAHTQERGTDWMLTYDYTVTLFSDNTYELSYKYSGQNTNDQKACGEQHLLTYGTYTIADDPEALDAEDNIDGVIITLNTADHVIYYQHERLGKYFGGEYYFDSAVTEWTDALAESTSCDTKDEFIAEKNAGGVIKAKKSTHLITSLEMAAGAED